MKRLAVTVFLVGCATAPVPFASPVARPVHGPLRTASALGPLASPSEFGTLPPIASSPEPKPPSVLEARTSNGIRVLGIQRRDFPIASIGITIKNAMPDGAPAGFRNVVIEAILRGSTNDLEARYATYSRNAIEWSTPLVSDRGAGYVIKALSPLLPSVLADALDMFANPHIGSRLVSTVIDKTRSGAKPANRSARSIAIDTALDRLFPRSAAFRAPDAAGLAVLAPAEVTDFIQAALKSDNLVVSAAGDFDWTALVAAVEAHLGRLQRGAVAWPAPEPTAPQGAVLIQSSVPQPVVVLAFRGPPTSHPDRAVMNVAKTAMDRFLDRTLRLRDGLTYGADVSLYSGRDAPPMILATTVEDGGILQAIDGLLEAVSKVERIEEADLEVAKTLARPTLVSPLSRVGAMVADLDWFGANDLRSTWFADRIQEVDRVTSNDVKRVVRNYLRREAMQVVVVGDVRGISAQVEARNLGPVTTAFAE